ncbi:VOC family protein [Alicyclobacillus dauci]|uniref:Glyoxalase-like domain-containing protein n=1 Tax=Alicyclobacillus dauci TaxID=1475485 RepID=A0ABY6Z160_9BACL|nr:hypothetical protein [Alicyclobacillus dauci]WAH36615.1 hypothetical protein NZD86_20930 [Alicyclobacillus dauci]
MPALTHMQTETLSMRVRIRTNVYFAVSDLDAFHTRMLQTECQVDASIKIQPWGERCFYAKDLFGNPICFVDDPTLFVG